MNEEEHQHQSGLIRSIFGGMRRMSDNYWKEVLEEAIDADRSRREFNSGRAVLSLERAMKIYERN